MKKNLALIALIAVPLLAGCGSSTSSSAPAAGGSSAAPAAAAAETKAAEPTVGTPFTADMGNGNVAKITIVSAKFVDKVSANQYAPAAKNGKFLQLDVLWETEKGTTSSNPMYFEAKDADGRKADMTIVGDGIIGSSKVAVGDKNRGFVDFDVAPGPIKVTISNPILQPVASLTITP
ncbi:DUF4352 domain-containing protein [Pseudarthrobacter sp. NIBRBAC000502770]|uniref:DUF4352 domain-containing protein n=1 Tax=Pseudarthrobacter sp. NIBRBAC000502770 TaxID=2590785 RepID=UPI0011406684|nr:DUF4352 domain-containing protein [Pseudarthrobacter sp. NIBRBAC000502770]QDG89081.1 DUF4352 domain-containing protein [Pseudarthrobacter sp. NIBRBAC000502770]